MLKHHRILVVEDDEAFMTYLTFKLMSLGYRNITTTTNGRDAVSLLQTEELFGLIITDMNMPFMNGQELIEWVKADNLRKQTPVLMICEPFPGQAEELSRFLDQRQVPLVLKSEVVGSNKLSQTLESIEMELS